jgi:single-stranded DNA-specific DHH superfamily exonuclease
MKVSLGEIYMSTSAMNKMIDASLPAKLSFRLVRAMREMNDVLKNLEEERSKLIKKYGKDNGDGNITVSEENKSQFLEEFTNLLSEEIEIQWEPIDPEALGDISLSVSDIAKIGFLFKQ